MDINVNLPKNGGEESALSPNAQNAANESASKTASTKKRLDTVGVVTLGLLTALIVVLQGLAIGIKFGIFSITLTLVPIIVGAALYGWKAGAWLGGVFGIVVLFTDAGLFLAINPAGTIATVLLKGVLAGAAAGFAYTLAAKANKIVAVIIAAIVSPIVNTGIFLLGCRVFFWETIGEWAAGAGFESAGAYAIGGMVGLNFLVELGINLVLSSAIVTIINLAKKKLRS